MGLGSAERASTNRSASPRLLTGHSSDNHIVQFYDREDFLASVVSDFLGAGLGAGEPAIVIATEPHREAFMKALRERGFDVPLAQQRGQLVLLDARATLSTFMVDGMPDWERYQRVIGSALEKLASAGREDRIRAYGEMVDLLWQDGNDKGALALEECWNRLAARYSFSLLCAYQMAQFGTEADSHGFAAVCATHTHVLPAESYDPAEGEAERMREIARLQQRAQALEAEVARRRAAEQELREALQTREDFVAIAGHELRTPLTPLSINIEAIGRFAESSAPSELRDRVISYAERSQRHVKRLSGLVTDLLDVSRIAAGRFTLEKSEVAYVEIVREVAQRHQAQAERAGCELVLSTPVVLNGNCDRLRLEQVLTNLLENAIKYGAKKPVRVTLETEGESVRITVKDDGIGIPPEHVDRIFDRFERAVSSKNYGGLGLGLFITRTIVEALGGSVTADSAPGQGAKFTVTLPR